jgi:hypothetical protein
MQLNQKERRQLFIVAMGLSIAVAANRGRGKPQAVAHRAYEFAQAALGELDVRSRIPAGKRPSQP